CRRRPNRGGDHARPRRRWANDDYHAPAQHLSRRLPGAVRGAVASRRFSCSNSPAERSAAPVLRSRRRMNLNLTTATRIGLNVLALLGAIIALRLGESVFIPLVFALLLSTILWSSANRLHDYYKLPWALACVVSVTVLVLFNLVLTIGFIFAIPRLAQDLALDDEKRQEEIYKRFRDNLE